MNQDVILLFYCRRLVFKILDNISWKAQAKNWSPRLKPYGKNSLENIKNQIAVLWKMTDGDILEEMAKKNDHQSCEEETTNDKGVTEDNTNGYRSCWFIKFGNSLKPTWMLKMKFFIV